MEGMKQICLLLNRGLFFYVVEKSEDKKVSRRFLWMFVTVFCDLEFYFKISKKNFKKIS